MWLIRWLLLLTIYVLTIIAIFLVRKKAFKEAFSKADFRTTLNYSAWIPLHILPSEKRFSESNPPPHIDSRFGYARTLKGFLFFAGGILSLFFLILFNPFLLVVLLFSKETYLISAILITVLQVLLCSFAIAMAYINSIQIAIRERIIKYEKNSAEEPPKEYK